MGITQYSPIPNQQVVQQYQPQDFRYLIAAGEQKQHAYDEAQAFDQNADSGMGKFAVRNVDVARRDQLHNEYVQKAQELVGTKYQNDYGAAMPELKKLANSYASNEFFSRATSALGRQKDMYETEKRIQEKGGSSLAFNRDAYSKPVYNKDGTYNDVDFDVQQRLDWAKPKMDLMKDIAKDSSISGLGYSRIAGMLEHGKTTGITGQKVAAVAGRMLEPYLSTPEGAQEMRYYTNGGHTREYAMGMMMRSLGGIGSKQIGMERDMSYTADALAKEKYDALKDQDQVIIGQGSQASDFSPVAGLNADDWVRKNRGETTDNINAATSTPYGAPVYQKTPATKNTYGDVSPEQRQKAAMLLQGTDPVLAKKISNGTATDAEQDKAAPQIKRRLDALGAMKWAPQVTTIPESMNYGSYGKGEVGATKMVEAKMSGMVWINKATNEKLSGKDFVEKAYNPARAAASKKGSGADGVMRVMGEVSPFNHFGLQHNDSRFGDAMQIALDGNEWVGGGLDQKKQHLVSDKYGRKATYLEDISGPRNQINEIATKTVSQLGSPVQILPGKDAPKFTLKLNDNGTYTFPEQKDKEGNPLTVENPTDYIQQALDHYEQLQHQQAGQAVTKRR